MKLTISNIDWATDGADVDLPSQVIVDDPMLLPHLIEDMDSDSANIALSLYGVCAGMEP